MSNAVHDIKWLERLGAELGLAMDEIRAMSPREIEEKLELRDDWDESMVRGGLLPGIAVESVSSQEEEQIHQSAKKILESIT